MFLFASGNDGCAFAFIGLVFGVCLIAAFAKMAMDMQMAKSNPEAYVRLRQIESEEKRRKQERGAAAAKGLLSVGSFLLKRRR